MANIKLTDNYWETSGIYDITQSKTQRQINADFNAALDSEVTARQNADAALQSSLNSVESNLQNQITPYVETGNTASRYYPRYELLSWKGKLYRVISYSIQAGDTFTEGANIELASMSPLLSEVTRTVYYSTNMFDSYDSNYINSAEAVYTNHVVTLYLNFKASTISGSYADLGTLIQKLYPWFSGNGYVITPIFDSAAPYLPIGTLWIYSNGKCVAYVPNNSLKGYASATFTTAP